MPLQLTELVSPEVSSPILSSLRSGGVSRARPAIVAVLLHYGVLTSCVSNFNPDSAPESTSQTPAAAPQSTPSIKTDVKARLLEVDSLGPTAAKDEEAQLQLVRALQDPDQDVAERAGYWLAKAGSDGLRHLIKALRDPRPRVQIVAAYALSQVGPEAQPAIPALTRVLGGASDTAAGMAAWALQQIAPKTASGGLPRVLMSLRWDSGFARAEAARSLGYFGLDAAPALPALVKALSDADPQVVTYAGRALVRIGPLAIPAVEAALLSPSPSTRAKLMVILVDLKRRPF